MINRTEYDVMDLLSRSLKAYGLVTNEVGVQVGTVNSVVGTHVDPLLDDGITFTLQARTGRDGERNRKVDRLLGEFIGDMVRECGINRHSDKCEENDGRSNPRYFRCTNLALSSMRPGAMRAVDDMTYGLERMIDTKKKTFASRTA